MESQPADLGSTSFNEAPFLRIVHVDGIRVSHRHQRLRINLPVRLPNVLCASSVEGFERLSWKPGITPTLAVNRERPLGSRKPHFFAAIELYLVAEAQLALVPDRNKRASIRLDF